ncbi:2036_t:CDS:2 [Entrophospora sp. SA101]|nr:2036_t:CDS:2 [Entrophospora sp. SA101]
MPDMVQTWISELENVVQAPEEVFMDELLAACDHLNEQEFLDLAQRMKIGIEKTLNVFKKWMITWTKFLLWICSLGGEHGPEFAQAVLNNLKDQNNTFGLFEALEKNNFREQFIAFSKVNYIQLKEFPLIYDFVRHQKLAVTRAKRREKASLSIDPVIGEEEAIRLAEEFLIPKIKCNILKNSTTKNQNNTFGLFEALEKNNFREQFIAFSKVNYIQLKEFPLIYDFVRHRI